MSNVTRLFPFQTIISTERLQASLRDLQRGGVDIDSLTVAEHRIWRDLTTPLGFRVLSMMAHQLDRLLAALGPSSDEPERTPPAPISMTEQKMSVHSPDGQIHFEVPTDVLGPVRRLAMVLGISEGSGVGLVGYDQQSVVLCVEERNLSREVRVHRQGRVEVITGQGSPDIRPLDPQLANAFFTALTLGRKGTSGDILESQRDETIWRTALCMAYLIEVSGMGSTPHDL